LNFYFIFIKTDQSANVIRKIDVNGRVFVFCGSGVPGYQDGEPSQAKFSGLFIFYCFV
jgi:hypothetical protein